MNTSATVPFQVATLLAMALVMSACSEAPSASPTPMTTTPQVVTPPAKGEGSNTSVPDAGSVLSPGTEPTPESTAGRTNQAMTRNQESSAMPMPGQNNDHSAPVSPAKRASSP